MPASLYTEAVRKACQDHVPAILYEWLPGGTISGKEYRCANINGGHGKNGSPGSFSVNLNTGYWKDFADATAPGGSDFISLYAAKMGYQGDQGYQRAKKELGDRFGVEYRKRATTRSSDWQAVVPIPPDAYQTDTEGNPLIPEGVLSGDAPVGIWPYFDAEGNLLQFILRFNSGAGKNIVALTYRRNASTGEFSWKFLGLPVPRPLYGLPELSSAPSKVLVVEGEKTADAARGLFPTWCVVTWPGGSQAVDSADWEPLRCLPCRTVLWPDHDTPGEQAMSKVAEVLGRPVEIIATDPRWPEKYDLADLARDGWTTEQAEAWIQTHSRTLAEEPRQERIEVDLSGRDMLRRMNAIFDSIASIPDANLFYAISGPVYLQPNIYGRVEMHSMDAKRFSSWCAKHLRTTAHTASGIAECEVKEALANAVLFNSMGKFPTLKVFSDTPIFYEKTLIDEHGYNKASSAFVSIPPDYKKNMALEEAWELVSDLLADFPFETASDLSAAVAYVCTAILRCSISGPTPLFRFEAPTPRTGKSLLCMCLSEIVTPHPEFVPEIESNDEARKTITSVLMKSPAVTVFDNLEKFHGTALKQVLSTDTWGDRQLGKNEMVSIPIRTVWAATLNNPELDMEMFERTVRVRLNANMENPSQRNGWRHPELLSYVRRNRGALVGAFVSICAAGVEGQEQPPARIGGFESFVRMAYNVAILNGYADPFLTRDEDRKISQDESELSTREFIGRWAETIGSSQATVTELCEIARDCHALPIKFVDGRPLTRSLGRLIKKMHGRVIAGCKIMSVNSGNNHFYFLESVSPDVVLTNISENLGF